MSDKLRGFYRSKYTRPDGKPAIAAVTQFEPTDARRCLPCWDEPAFKATFDVTLVVPTDRVALSNMVRAPLYSTALLRVCLSISSTSTAQLHWKSTSFGLQI